MIVDTLLEVYMKEGRDEPEAMGQIAEDAIRGKRVRENSGDTEQASDEVDE